MLARKVTFKQLLKTDPGMRVKILGVTPAENDQKLDPVICKNNSYQDIEYTRLARDRDMHLPRGMKTIKSRANVK